MTDKVEILAPCGSYESLVAAVSAGANAVYLSGKSFGARAYALNFTDEDILDAITYAHRNNVRVYLTVNTLLKSDEIIKVADYLAPFYKNGLDAVIVQDFGVFSVVKEAFPDMDIHCSTQMNVSSYHSAEYMKKLGAKRVVTAREMSLQEIREISERVDIEIETFVHGALCYSFSGRCLMSQAIGDRSGNRGRCAQPCRKAYSSGYCMSMKDLCSVTEIPEIVDSGIYSLKIEGRMKNAIYTAATTKAYRELTDDYINGRFSMDKAIKYKERLTEIFNRGGFTDGYFNMHNGSNMITKEKPGNCGVKVGCVTKISNGKINVKLDKEIGKGDSFELQLKGGDVINLTAPCDAKKGENYELNSPKTKFIRVGDSVIRMKNEKITKETELLINTKKKLPVNICAYLHKGELLRLSASAYVFGNRVESEIFGEEVLGANNAPVTKSQLAEKLKKLGDFPFAINKLDIDCEEDIFIHMSAFNNLRRELMNKLLSSIDSSFLRDNSIINKNINNYEYKLNTDLTEKDYNKNGCLSVMAETLESLLTIEKLSCEYELERVYIPYHLIYEGDMLSDRLIMAMEKLRENGVKTILKLPELIRSKYENKLKDILGLLDMFDGIYLTSLDSLYIAEEYDLKNKIIVLSASIYAYNDYSILFLYERLKDKCNRVIYTMPEELSFEELEKLKYPEASEVEIIGYGRQKVMITAQCIRSLHNKKCEKNRGFYTFTDELGNTFLGETNCDMCYNTLYNSVPTSLHQYKMELPSIRLDITDEGENVINRLVLVFSDREKDYQKPDYKYTTGKYKRGIL